jgi:signal transduction histidine kinase
VVQTHGGTIDVRSRIGEGTTFDLYFSMNEGAAAVAA